MAVITSEDYEKLAKLLYPSIEASGNIYYGQTRKLILDSLLDKASFSFNSHIDTTRVNDPSADYGFSYKSYFNWAFGPFQDSLETIPNADAENTSTFPNVAKFWNLEDGELVEYSADTDFSLNGTVFAKYSIDIQQQEHNNYLNSGNFKTYDFNSSIEMLGLVITNGCSPINFEDFDLDNKNIFVELNDRTGYLYVKILSGFVTNKAHVVYTDNIHKPLTIKAIDGAATVSLGYLPNGNQGSSQFIYSKNNGPWTSYQLNDPLTIAESEYISFICTYHSPQDSMTSLLFTIEGGLVEANHNVNSLLSESFDSITDLTPYGDFTFQQLFQNCSNLVKAPMLPATTLTNCCYQYMFFKCTSLKNPPELPGINFSGTSIYDSMFRGCSSLKIAPELPATTLVPNCYHRMFEDCISLEKSPDILPATELTYRCYSNMFNNCSSLAKAPILPATSANSGVDSYASMFSDCTSLNEIHCFLQQGRMNVGSFLLSVSETGTFYYKGTDWFASPLVPENWTQLPEPVNQQSPQNSNFDKYTPFTITAVTTTTFLIRSDVFYFKVNGVMVMDGESTRLTPGQTASITVDSKKAAMDPEEFGGGEPELGPNSYTELWISEGDVTFSGNLLSLVYNEFEFMNHDEVPDYGFYRLFQSSATISSAPELPFTNLGAHCYEDMFDSCTNLTTPPELPATVLKPYCYSRMLSHCPALTKAPELPATALEPYCYERMFEYDTALVETPKLPATKLATNCYERMFYGCSNLNKLFCDARSLNQAYSTNWMANVAGSGIAYVNLTADIPIGETYGIPDGWVKFEEIYNSQWMLPANNYKEGFILTTGFDSDYNGRGKIDVLSTKTNMLKSNPLFEYPLVDQYDSTTGGMIQDVWGYKCFNSPVSFRNGIYGEGSRITAVSSVPTQLGNTNTPLTSFHGTSIINDYNYNNETYQNYKTQVYPGSAINIATGSDDQNGHVGTNVAQIASLSISENSLDDKIVNITSSNISQSNISELPTECSGCYSSAYTGLAGFQSYDYTYSTLIFANSGNSLTNAAYIRVLSNKTNSQNSDEFSSSIQLNANSIVLNSASNQIGANSQSTTLLLGSITIGSGAYNTSLEIQSNGSIIPNGIAVDLGSISKKFNDIYSYGVTTQSIEAQYIGQTNPVMEIHAEQFYGLLPTIRSKTDFDVGCIAMLWLIDGENPLNAGTIVHATQNTSLFGKKDAQNYWYEGLGVAKSRSDGSFYTTAQGYQEDYEIPDSLWRALNTVTGGHGPFLAMCIKKF